MTYKHVPRHAPYLSDPFRDLSDLVKKAKKAFKGVEFDGFAGTGLSGTMVVPVLAYAMRKRFAIVRKHDDQGHHSCGEVESGLKDGDKWVFIDDFISSGATQSRVVHKMAEHHDAESGVKATYIGSYLYNSLAQFQPGTISDIPKRPDKP